MITKESHTFKITSEAASVQSVKETVIIIVEKTAIISSRLVFLNKFKNDNNKQDYKKSDHQERNYSWLQMRQLACKAPLKKLSLL